MTIGVDLDEVLADLMTSFLKFHNYNYGGSLVRDQINTYRLWEVFGITREEAVKRMIEFYNSHYCREIKPVPGSIWSVTNLSRKDELFVVTSRLEEGVEQAKEWIDRYFSNKFRDIYFANNVYAQDDKEKTKGDICVDLDIDILIEDSLEYSLQCIEDGINILLLDCPWNQLKEGKDLPRGIIRAFNWRQILRIV